MQEKQPAPEVRDRPTQTNIAPAGHDKEYESRLSGRTGLFPMAVWLCKNAPACLRAGFAPVTKRFTFVTF
jgi:hypothetical protein